MSYNSTNKSCKKTLQKLAACAAVIMAATVASADVNYIIPWYVNPTFKANVLLGNEQAKVTMMNIDAAGEYLALGAEADGDFVNVQAYKLSELETLTSYTTDGLANGFNGRIASSAAGLGDSPVVAVSTAAGAVVGVNGDLSAAASMLCGPNRWIGRFAPTQLAFSESDSVSSFVFNKAGTAAWANSLASGRTGTIVEWTLSNGTFSKGREIDTGLSAIQGIGVYTISNVEYVVVGEADSSATTAGTVKRINVATGAVTTFVEDAAHLGAGIVSVKMSHTDYFRPRLYALLASGDIACYYIRPERTPTEVKWSKTVSNSDLLTAAVAPWTAEHAKVTAFDVFPNGGTVAIAYRRNAGDETAPAESEVPETRVVLLKHTPRKWYAYGVNDNGNPRKGVAATLTDGEWQLNYAWSGSDIRVGSVKDSDRGSAWTSDEMHEFLDLSYGYAVKASDNKTCKINQNYSYAFATNSTFGGRGPRVFLPSTQISQAGQFAKDWQGIDSFEEIVFFDSKQNLWPIWAGLASAGDRRYVMNMTSLNRLDKWSAYGNSGKAWGGGSRFEDQNFPVLETIGEQCFKLWQAAGALSLPSASIVSNSCFAYCSNMTALALGDKVTSTILMHDGAFQRCTSLKTVRFGGTAQVHFTANNVFDKCPLEEVVFNGNVPTKESNVATIWSDTVANQIVFAVPRNNATWEAVINDPSKVKTRLTLQEQEEFFRTHPGRCIPFGIVDKSVVGSKNDQYIAYNDAPGGYAIKIEKDEFFDDEVTITSDRARSSDGRFMPGSTVTLTAAPGATGTFRKWYGDVPKEQCTQQSVTFTLNENRWIYCRMVHPWTIASDKKTASNGNFTINCASANASARTITVGLLEKTGFYADNDVGSGVCDLGGAVYLEGDSTPWKFSNFTVRKGMMVGTQHGKGNADAVITPGTFSYMPADQFLHTGDIADARSLKMFIVDEPNMYGNWVGWSTCGNIDLTRLIIHAPKMSGFTGDGSLWYVPLTETDLAWWDLSGLTRLDDGSFAGMDWNTYVGGYGVLTLPALRGLNHTSTSKRSPLWNMKNVEAFVIGGKTKADTVTNLCKKAFMNDAKLRSVTIYNDAGMTVDTEIFNGATSIKEIWLQGAAIGATDFANLLDKITAGATKPVKVYVSRLMPGWTSTTYLDYSPSEAEKAEAPGEKVFAVYRGAAAAPSGKALIIHRSGEYDPRSTIIVIR